MKSITIRLCDDDLTQWAASQSSPVSSVRMAIKMCILQYGADSDLLDAVLESQFGDGNIPKNKRDIVTKKSDKNISDIVVDTSEEVIQKSDESIIPKQQSIQPSAPEPEPAPQAQSPTSTTNDMSSALRSLL